MRSANTTIKQGFDVLPEAVNLTIRATGKTLQELFGNALRGMAFYLHPDALRSVKGVRRIAETIRIDAVDVNSLLVEFLSEAIARSDAAGAVFADVAFRAFGENFLEGEIAGVAVAESRDIRAVSYQDIDIKKNPATGLFETLLVFET